MSSVKKILSFLGVIVAGAALLFILDKDPVSRTPAVTGGNYPEISAVENLKTFQELETYFKTLATDKGARYAYEVLKVAPIPEGTDMHLMGHVVGDVLYQQEGLEGITACTQDFRNACSHSIVVGLFSDRGEQAFPEIIAACKKAPGGSGAYTMCFHGLGHGILAATGYDMEKTAEFCKKTSTGSQNREATECIGGSVMEIVGGGFHDRQIWEVQREKYLKKSEPLGLCQGNIVPKEARYMCLVYLTPFLFQAAGADLAQPQPAHFAKGFEYCKTLPDSDAMGRDACFGGFGKEFTVLAMGRDIRQAALENISDEVYKNVYEWCALAKDKNGSAACIVHAMNSLYWGGENSRSIAMKFCGAISDEFFGGTCFQNLIGAVSFYITDQNYRREFCEEIPKIYTESCRTRLKIK